MRIIFTDENKGLTVCEICLLSFDESEGIMSAVPTKSCKYEIHFHGLNQSAYRYYAKKMFADGTLNLSCMKAVYHII